MKLILALILAAGVAYGQTTVNITNSLIGPVTQNFSNTQVNVSEAVITGAVVNASVTNSFAPVNNITSIVSVGSTTVNNTNIFDNVITNVINNFITNIIENVVQSNNYFTTSGVSSISFTGAVDGAITFAGNAVTQTNKTFNFSYIDTGFTNIVSEGSGNVVTNLVAGTGRTITQQLGTVSASGGGLNHFQSSTGLTTQTGSFLFPTSNVAVLTNGTFGIFIGTNSSISVNRPDGTIDGGNARGAGSVDLQPAVAGTLSTRASASQVVSSPWSFMAAAYRSTISSASGGNVILCGESGNSSTISSGEGSAIIAHSSGTISGAGGNNAIIAGDSGTISSSLGNNLILGGRTSQTIGGGSVDSFLLGNYDCDILGNSYATGIQSSEGSIISITNNTFFASASIIGSGYSRILSFGTDRTRNSSIISGWTTTNAGKGSIAMGYRVVNTNDGNLVFASWNDGTTVFSPVKSNTATFRVPNGFGINTNNPQESLHVDGKIQITGIKIYASGTNLFLTDGATYTNRINVTPE